METIHLNSNDIFDLDKNQISLISLKDGNMIILDDDVQEKPKQIKKYLETDRTKSDVEKITHPLTVSDQLTLSFIGKKDSDNSNNDKLCYNNNERKNSFKSDFNLLSQISKNNNFCYQGNYQFNPFKENKENIPMNHGNPNNNKYEKSYGNFNQIIESNTNKKQNFNQNISLNNQIKLAQNENNNILNNKIIKPSNEMNKKQDDKDDLNERIRRKSRNYLDKLEKLILDRNKPIVNAVISLNIPSDNPQEISATQRKFNMMVSQLRQKQNKNRKNSDIGYQRYYQLYKDKNPKLNNNKIYPMFNRIKYYQESQNEDFENEFTYNGNDSNIKSNRNNIMNSSNNINLNFYGNVNNGLNKSIKNNYMSGGNDLNLNKSMTSFNATKTRSSIDYKVSSTKLVRKGVGRRYSLILPSNSFTSRL